MKTSEANTLLKKGIAWAKCVKEHGAEHTPAVAPNQMEHYCKLVDRLVQMRLDEAIKKASDAADAAHGDPESSAVVEVLNKKLDVLKERGVCSGFLGDFTAGVRAITDKEKDADALLEDMEKASAAKVAELQLTRDDLVEAGKRHGYDGEAAGEVADHLLTKVEE